MTQKIFEIKKKLIEEVETELDRMGSIRNMDTRELGMVVDMIKDLAEAEEKCWKACYYKSVVEAMEQSAGDNIERMGYIQEPDDRYNMHRGTMGYQSMMGYRGGSMGGRGGYSDQSIQNIKQMMEVADPQRKEQLKQDLQKLMQEVGI